jgi:hypothetical protein
VIDGVGSRRSVLVMEASASLVSKARMFWRRALPARGFAGEGEHLGDVVDVLGADLLVLVAGAGVVVALGQAEAALVDGGDLLGGVLEVLLLAEAEEDVDAMRCSSPVR